MYILLLCILLALSYGDFNTPFFLARNTIQLDTDFTRDNP